MLDAIQTLVDNGLTDETLDSVIEDLLEYTDGDDKLCLVALSWSREQGNKTIPDDITHISDDCVNISGDTYRILDDDEMETAWDECLEQYGSECIPGWDGTYFNRDKWKADARHDGVGHSLSPYDGDHIEHADYNLFRIS